MFFQIIPFQPTQTVLLNSLNFSTTLLLRRFCIHFLGADLSAFFGASHLCDILGNGGELPVACPLYWGNMITSIHVKTAIDLALFHLERTNQGQRIDLNLMRSGVS